ncbi:hypothetical protein [Clostridium sp. ZBS15]|nr:hypothetical protein [Clostridium sp. ZBS15]
MEVMEEKIDIKEKEESIKERRTIYRILNLYNLIILCYYDDME